MIRLSKDKALTGAALLASAALLLILSAGAAMSAPAEHDDIVLRDRAGTPITDLTGAAPNAFSMRMTCGTTDCHDGSGEGAMAVSFDEIERHSYHAQVAANAHEGWASYNPDGTTWESGPAAKGKNWVQGQGHMGAW
ncbi:MAG: cytochrome C [Desulfuromonas sp.]|uniref:hypothetical protein n=1 Tax=Desulfuromonas sp. TaxID=892 RepID=UPI000CBC5B6A|nr:hypothetical protein [Desulfuromonas sp.]PLX86524.1 MAG: cytochrome C [Desulfuromonas sp.]